MLPGMLPEEKRKARPLQRHVFICTNERDSGNPRGCCQTKGASEVLEKFKTTLIARRLKGQIRAQKAGCLDTCEYGASVVVYPDNVWYGKVTVQDVDQIIDEHLINGQPVERLLIPGKQNSPSVS